MSSHSNLEKKAKTKYLFIGGAPKCGTTSLFRYLSDHPEVCPARRKETYFFARKFDLKKVSTGAETTDEFEKYFSHCSSTENLRIEATPYTLYAKDAAKKISTLLPNSEILFILRNPIKRLMSDYRFHLQRHHPSTRGSLDDFFEWQFNMRGDIPSLIKMGCYIDYIRKFLNEFDRNRVHIMIFKDFIANPRDELQELCNGLGIDNAFYQNYSFELHNPTINVRSTWLHQKSMRFEPVIDEIRERLLVYPRFNKVFQKLIKIVKITYWKINNQRSPHDEIFPPDMQAYLLDYYRPYNAALSNVLGRALLWELN